VTDTVAEILGTPARTYRQWVTNHADAFTGKPTSAAM
jgi:hypothetical protein